MFPRKRDCLIAGATLALAASALAQPEVTLGRQPTAGAARATSALPDRPQHWIWAPGPAASGETVFFRQPFRLSVAPRAARIRIAARGRFTLYVNGRAVATHASAQTPGDAFITAYVSRGQNVIGVLCQATGAQPGVAWEAVILYPNGDDKRLRSVATVATSRAYVRGWNLPDFNARGWVGAAVLGAVAPSEPSATVTPVRPGRPAPRPAVSAPAYEDATRLVRVWDVVSDGRTGSPYGRPATEGARMFMASPMPNPSDLPLVASAGFTLLETAGDPLSTGETAPGEWDFRRALSEAQAARAGGFDWSYFPRFAFPPAWYRTQVPFARITCMEHDQPAQAFSPWEPKFATAITDGYQKLTEAFPAPGIAALNVGIHGDFGDAGLLTGSYLTRPGTRSDWFSRFGDYHDHLGWWCADNDARKGFRDAMLRKYGDLDGVNAAWHTRFAADSDIALPTSPARAGRRYWLDFVHWYQTSVANVTDYICRTARRGYPELPMTVPVGFPDEDPRTGADYSLLAVTAAKQNVAVRTRLGGLRPFAANQAGSYGRIASACRYYNVPFWTEAVGALSPDAESERFFEAASQGARGYVDYPDNVRGARDVFYRQGRYLRAEKPIVDVAMFFPTTSHLLKLDEPYPPTLLKGCTDIRDVLNYDMLDERMIRDNALDGYRVLVLWEGTVVEGDVLDKIRDWVLAGGVLVAYDFGKVETVEGDRSWYGSMFAQTARLRAAADVTRFVPVGPLPDRYRIAVGRPDAAPFLDGSWLAPEVTAGVPERYTGPSGSVRLPVNPQGDYVLTVRAAAPVQGRGEFHDVLLNDQRVGAIVGATEATYRFTVPRGASASGVLNLTFASRSARSPSTSPTAATAHARGVRVSYVELAAAPAPPAAGDPGVPNGRFETGVDTDRLRTDWARPYGRGWTVFYPATRRQLAGYYEVVRYLTYHLSEIDPSKRDAIAVDDAWDGLYATLCSDKVLYYNATGQRITRTISLPAGAFVGRRDLRTPRELAQTVTVDPHAIGAMYFDTPAQELLLQCEKFTVLGGLKPLTGDTFSPGRGPTHVLVPTNGQISTRFECTVPGGYSVFYRAVRRGGPAWAEVLLDGKLVTGGDTADRRGLTAPNTRLAGTANLTVGVHTLTVRPRRGEDIRADFVVLSTDPTVAGYRFAVR